MRRAWSIGLVVAIALGCPALARAHPLVDQGRRLVEEARFEEAEQALRRADEATDLTIADVARLLETRAILHLALSRNEAMVLEMRRLASIDPAHGFADSVPPEIVEAYARARAESAGQLRVEVDVHEAPGGLTIEPRAVHDVGTLVRSLHLYTRLGDEPWQRSAGGVTRALAPGQTLQMRAEAVGPGGAIVAVAGSEREPLRASMPGGEEPEPDVTPTGTGGRDDYFGLRRVSIWVYIVGGAVILAGVTTFLLLYFKRSDETDLGRPRLRGAGELF